MRKLVFSLQSEITAQLAVKELVRNGVPAEHIQVLDRLTRFALAEDSDEPIAADALFNRETSAGRVLLAVDAEPENSAAVSRVVQMLAADARSVPLAADATWSVTREDAAPSR